MACWTALEEKRVNGYVLQTVRVSGIVISIIKYIHLVSIIKTYSLFIHSLQELCDSATVLHYIIVFM